MCLIFERSFDKLQSDKECRPGNLGEAMTYTTATITQRYHDAIVDWQERNFPELEILMKHWDDYFRGVPPFQLLAKVGDLWSPLLPSSKPRADLTKFLTK